MPKEKFMDEKSPWSPTWQTMDKANHGSQTVVNDWQYIYFFNSKIFSAV